MDSWRLDSARKEALDAGETKEKERKVNGSVHRADKEA